MQAQLPSAPPAPPAPATPGRVGVAAPTSATPTSATPAQIYQGLRAQRRELVRQLESLEERRSGLSERLEETAVGGADRKGLEQRIADVDQRISAVDQQLAAADGEVARAAAVPGAAVEPPGPPRQGPPEEAFVLGGIFLILVFFPISIAYARRIWRRGAAAVAAVPQELGERLHRLEQAVDSIALEIERIGEGQRFVTRLFGEQSAAARAIGAAPAEPIEVKARDPEAHLRR